MVRLISGNNGCNELIHFKFCYDITKENVCEDVIIVEESKEKN